VRALLISLVLALRKEDEWKSTSGDYRSGRAGSGCDPCDGTGLKTVVVEKDPFAATCLHVRDDSHQSAADPRGLRSGQEWRGAGVRGQGLKINGAKVWRGKTTSLRKHTPTSIEFLFKKKQGSGAGLGKYEGPGSVSAEKDGKKTRLKRPNHPPMW